MKSLVEIKKYLSDNKPELQRRFGITELGVFGSYVRGEQRPDSDVDVYVDYAEIPSLLKIINLENYLSDGLNEKVDLVPRECIRPELEKYILGEVLKV